MKKSLEGFKGRFEQAEERISKIEDKTMEIIKSKEQKEKKDWRKETEPKGSVGHHQENKHAAWESQ